MSEYISREAAVARLHQLAVDLPAAQISVGESRASEIEHRARSLRAAIYEQGESATHAARVADIDTDELRRDIARDEAAVWAHKDEASILQFLIEHDLCP